MLQSQGSIIRVFPAFDPYRRARFHHLRAKGGFLVSSEVDRGFVKWIEIEATIPGECRIRIPWPAGSMRIEQKGTGMETAHSRDGNDVVFSARVGTVYRFEPQVKVHRLIE
jgi:hypothetical protein